MHDGMKGGLNFIWWKGSSKDPIERLLKVMAKDVRESQAMQLVLGFARAIAEGKVIVNKDFVNLNEVPTRDIVAYIGSLAYSLAEADEARAEAERNNEKPLAVYQVAEFANEGRMSAALALMGHLLCKCVEYGSGPKAITALIEDAGTRRHSPKSVDALKGLTSLMIVEFMVRMGIMGGYKVEDGWYESEGGKRPITLSGPIGANEANKRVEWFERTAEWVIGAMKGNMQNAD